MALRALKRESALGIELDRPVKISDGSVIVAFGGVDNAPVPKGVSALWIESNCPVKISDGSIIVAFGGICDAPGAQGERASLEFSRIASL